MSSIFNPSRPTPGPSKEDLDAQAQREQRAESQETNEKKKIASRGRSKKKGGSRILMTQERENPAEGNEMAQSTLGPNRNPRV